MLCQLRSFVYLIRMHAVEFKFILIYDLSKLIKKSICAERNGYKNEEHRTSIIHGEGVFKK